MQLHYYNNVKKMYAWISFDFGSFIAQTHKQIKRDAAVAVVVAIAAAIERLRYTVSLYRETIHS